MVPVYAKGDPWDHHGDIMNHRVNRYVDKLAREAVVDSTAEIAAKSTGLLRPIRFCTVGGAHSRRLDARTDSGELVGFPAKET